MIKEGTFPKKIISVLILLAVVLTTQAQTPDIENAIGAVFSYASDKGNYLQVANQAETMDEVMAKTQYFRVEKVSVFAKDNKKPQTLGRIEKSATYADIVNKVGSEDAEGFKEAYGFATNEEFADFIRTNESIENVLLLNQTNIDFLRVNGYGFLDIDVSPGDVDTYYVYRVDKDETEELWSATTIVAGGGNSEINKVSVELKSVFGLDSMVTFFWQPTFPVFEGNKEPNEESFTKTEANFEGATRRSIREVYVKEYSPYFNPFEVTSEQTKFIVSYRINNETEWLETPPAFTGYSADSNLAFSVGVRCLPEDLIYTRVIAEDYAGNRSVVLDESVGVAITNATTVLIYGINAEDSTNSVVVTWDALPAKPYYTGIEVGKMDSNGVVQVLDVLPPTAIRYIDFDVFPVGQARTYFVKALFLPKQNLVQEAAATSSASPTDFSLPLPPFNLEVEDLGTQPRLFWEAADDPARYAFYLYRGDSPNNLELMNDNIFENEFTDSTIQFYKRSTYYYAVLAMNVIQDTSEFSNVVVYSPSQANPDIQPPRNLSHTLINGNVFLEWFDEKKADDFVSGYILERRPEADSTAPFVSLHGDILIDPFFVDTTFDEKLDYRYRLASISYEGDTSTFSPEVEVGYILQDVPAVRGVELYNYTEGIGVTWPTIGYEAISQFQVYRREFGAEEFNKIAETENDTFDFIDENVNSGITYEYAVTVIEQDGRESYIRSRSSIVRK
jgi:hypothetical protein